MRISGNADPGEWTPVFRKCGGWRWQRRGSPQKRVGAGARNFCVGVERVTSASGSYPREGEGEGGGCQVPGGSIGGWWAVNQFSVC